MLILDFVEERVVEDRPQRKVFRKRDKENNKELIFLTKPEKEFYKIAKKILEFDIKIRQIT